MPPPRSDGMEAALPFSSLRASLIILYVGSSVPPDSGVSALTRKYTVMASVVAMMSLKPLQERRTGS
eukprot:scaffold323744_cov111-Attheya_sp.AAC.1